MAITICDNRVDLFQVIYWGIFCAQIGSVAQYFFISFFAENNEFEFFILCQKGQKGPKEDQHKKNSLLLSGNMSIGKHWSGKSRSDFHSSGYLLLTGLVLF